MSAVDERLDRIEKAISTLAWWLVQAQSGLGEQDARGIDKILAAPTTRGARNA